jgi:hypothetical protein
MRCMHVFRQPTPKSYPKAHQCTNLKPYRQFDILADRQSTLKSGSPKMRLNPNLIIAIVLIKGSALDERACYVQIRMLLYEVESQLGIFVFC